MINIRKPNIIIQIVYYLATKFLIFVTFYFYHHNAFKKTQLLFNLLQNVLLKHISQEMKQMFK